MRIWVTGFALLAVVGIAALSWSVVSGPTPSEADRIAAVLAPTAPASEPAAYAPCASCHLHDGSGRPDGSIPRLSGQRQSVLENKLHRLRSGMMRLPVMEPFARTLAPDDIAQIAKYLSELPEPSVPSPQVSPAKHAQGASLYAQHCASCHGVAGEGQDGVFASRLCGQYGGYLNRRLDEAASKSRGDADAIMQGVVDLVPPDELRPIVAFLAAGRGCQAR